MIKSSRLLGAVCASVFSFAAVPSHAALVDNGGGLIYDTVLDITWAQPENSSDRTWTDARAYVAGLTLGGVSGWRLPYASVAAGPSGSVNPPVDCNSASEADCQDNEMGYMFYYNLGGQAGFDIYELDSGVAFPPTVPNPNPNLALFSDITPDTFTHYGYWSDTRGPIGFPQTAWAFEFGGTFAGGNSNELITLNRWTWAVHDGNVSAVPVPAAVWLFGSGLLGLVGMARRKKAA